MELNRTRDIQLLSIQQLSQKLNLPKSTLRFWEKAFEGFIVPERTEGGQRRYNPEHIVILEGIKKLREKEMKLSEIKRKLNNHAKKDNSNLKEIDLFAERLAKIIKDELYNFFK